MSFNEADMKQMLTWANFCEAAQNNDNSPFDWELEDQALADKINAYLNDED